MVPNDKMTAEGWIASLQRVCGERIAASKQSSIEYAMLLIDARTPDSRIDLRSGNRTGNKEKSWEKSWEKPWEKPWERPWEKIARPLGYFL